jgi:hypothetical protein
MSPEQHSNGGKGMAVPGFTYGNRKVSLSSSSSPASSPSSKAPLPKRHHKSETA